MNNLYFRQLKIGFYTSGNAFFYYLSKFPLIKRLVKDSWYANSDLKLVFAVLGKIREIITAFIIGVLSLFVVLIFPAIIFRESFSLRDRPDVVFHIVFWMFCITGAFLNTSIAVRSVKRDDYIMLHVMHCPAKGFYLTRLTGRLLKTFADFLPLLFFCKFKAYLICSLYIMCFRCAGEAFELFVYDKLGENKICSNILSSVLLLSGIGIGEALCIYKVGETATYSVMTSAAGILCTAAATVISLVYLITYRKYRMAAHELVTVSALETDIMLSDTKNKPMKAHLMMSKSDEKNVSQDMGKYEEKKGYAYLTALFFSRHGHLFKKKVIKKSLVILAVELITALLVVFKPGLFEELTFERVIKSSPVMIYWFFLLSSGAGICESMFCNCDRALLKYGYYRNGRAVLENFRYRIRYIILIDFIPSLFFCILPFEFMIITGGNAYIAAVLMVCAGYLSASVFFSVFHTVMYYLFQPYTEDMTVHGKAYKAINIIVALGVYTLFNADEFGWGVYEISMFFLIFSAASMLFIPVSLYLVYRIAPKSFYLK